MPIPINYRTMPISPEDVKTLLQAETDSFGTFFNLDRMLYHEGRYSRIAASRYPEFRAMCGVPSIKCTQRNDVRNIFMRRFNVPEYKLTNKDGKVSMAQDVVDKLLKDETLGQDAHHFLELYNDISSAEYMASYLGQYLSLPISNVEDMDNQRMVVAHPEWKVLATSRFSASSPSVQNINRDICDIYTAPKGWQLVFSDSGQIEPRITYSAYIRDDLIVKLITMYDDAYYGLLHFILLTDEEERNLRSNLDSIKLHEVTAEMKDKRQRLKVLGLAGNYGSSNLASIDPELGPLYEKKIVNHHARKALEAEVTAAVRNGAEFFNGYFGTRVYPDNTQKYHKGDASWAGHMIRCGINNPIQTTAAELMCISVMNAKRILGPKDHIGSYKHDEGMFYVRNEHVEELAPKLRECLSYAVEGWIPIGSDLHIGRKESPYVTNIF